MLLAASLIACATKPFGKTSFAPNPVVAHRGAWKARQLPENSLASLRAAIELGCTGSEFDVRCTADDSLVVAHDAEYGGLDIEASTYARLAATPLANGEPLPTLRSYVSEGLRENPSTRLVCEVKPSPAGRERGVDIARRTVALVEALGARDRTAYISFDYDELLAIREAAPYAHTEYLEGDKAPAELAADGIGGLDYNLEVFREHPEWIAEAKQLGLALNAWTVDGEADLRWLLGERFALITTNEPELLLRLADER